MKYMGSKARHAKDLLPILLKDRKAGQWYVEPFVGGANIIDKVSGLRLGSDLDQNLIDLWQAVSRGWEAPEKFCESDYKLVRDYPKDFEPALVGYCGFALSYGGKKFGGWRRDAVGIRDYVAESHRSACKQFPLLLGVDFRLSSYLDLEVPPESIIYCDPPYKGTTSYSSRLDHKEFEAWCRSKHAEGHQVFVSEYAMPDDFECVWSKEVASSLTSHTGSKQAVERLFTLK